MFDKLDWLTVQQLIAYHTLITVYRIRKSKVPEDISTTLCRDNQNGHIVIKNTGWSFIGNLLSSGALCSGTSCLEK